MSRKPTSAPVSRSRTSPPNPGMPLDLRWIRSLSVSRTDVAARVEALRPWTGPRPGEVLPSLHRVLRSLDLTTLSGDDTAARVGALCRVARSPLPRDLRRRLSLAPEDCRVTAVCVFPAFIPRVRELLAGSGVSAATVAGGFPHGLSTLPERIAEVGAAREAGAEEIDVVIRREWALTGKWDHLYREIAAMRSAAGEAHLKVILSTGEMETPSQVARAALTAMMAGADFVKTSTGKERVNATLEAGVAMASAIRTYNEAGGLPVGLKAAGGIRTPREAMDWLHLVEQELGAAWTEPSRFRIGASSLLDAVVGELRELAQGA